MRNQMMFGFADVESKQILQLTPFNKEIEDMLMELIDFYSEDFNEELGEADEIDELDMIFLLIMDKHRKMKNQKFLESALSKSKKN